MERISGSTSGFVGFDSLQGLGYVAASASATDTVENQLLPSIRAALKKLSKRDAITKTKVGT
jgi:hypothetical protein